MPSPSIWPKEGRATIHDFQEGIEFSATVAHDGSSRDICVTIVDMNAMILNDDRIHLAQLMIRS